MPNFSNITGLGSALPKRLVSNAELVKILADEGIESSAEWIETRTGIEQRFFASEHENTATLAIDAAKSALSAAKVDPKSLDLIIVATSTPAMTMPSTACMVQFALGIEGFPAFDLQAVCSGFVYALIVADQMIKTGMAKTALVIGSEVFSKLLDFHDRTTCVLFGDGAGAALLQAHNQGGIGILASHLAADGRHIDMLKTEGVMAYGQIKGHPYLTMDGQAVYRFAINVLTNSALQVLQQVNMSVDAIDRLIVHQANIRIMRAVAQRIGMAEEKVITTIKWHGNTSAASIPLALDHAWRLGQVRQGQKILLQGVGAGFTWGSCLIQL